MVIEVRVNNHLCETRENLEVLEKYAQLQLWLTELDELWDPYIVSAKNDRRRIERYQEQGRQLKTFVDNYSGKHKFKIKFGNILFFCKQIFF